jgi:hypothetical protein
MLSFPTTGEYANRARGRHPAAIQQANGPNTERAHTGPHRQIVLRLYLLVSSRFPLGA